MSDMVRRAVFLQRSANPDIAYDLDIPENPVSLACDDRQIGQALTNLLQNAADSILARPDTADCAGGEIHVAVEASPDQITIAVGDNGIGLPKGIDRDITDPYVTTRTEGTGLGLAIVRKIMEDHNGSLDLEDIEIGGARVSLVFPAHGAANDGAAGDQSNGPEDHGA